MQLIDISLQEALSSAMRIPPSWPEETSRPTALKKEAAAPTGNPSKRGVSSPKVAGALLWVAKREKTAMTVKL